MVREVNNKGQALIESLIVGLILISTLFFTIRVALIAQQNTLVDEFIEQTMICLAQQNVDCEVKLKKQLEALNFRSISIQNLSNHPKFSIVLKAVTPFSRILEKESELELDLQVAK